MEDKKKKKKTETQIQKTKNKMAVARCTAECLTTIAVHKSKRCGLEIKKEMREKKEGKLSLYDAAAAVSEIISAASREEQVGFLRLFTSLFCAEKTRFTVDRVHLSLRKKKSFRLEKRESMRNRMMIEPQTNL